MISNAVFGNNLKHSLSAKLMGSGCELTFQLHETFVEPLERERLKLVRKLFKVKK